jgi:hypothetical protein
MPKAACAPSSITRSRQASTADGRQTGRACETACITRFADSQGRTARASLQFLFEPIRPFVMSNRRRYRPRPDKLVIAVPLRLDTDGFTYRKWSSEQRCKQGDWIVDNGGDFYTVDAEVFARTYQQASPGVYRKVTPVWAEVAQEAGQVVTKEGMTRYEKGDYLVFNREDGTDAYATRAEKFEASYELDDD